MFPVLRCVASQSAQPAHWALFHIAGLFFRVVGNPFHALECMRRAVHFAPFVARDVPLLGMAEILHRTGQMADAVVLLRAALGTHPEQVCIVGSVCIRRVCCTGLDHVTQG